MQAAGTGLQLIAWLGTLICFILVLIRIFQSGQTALGVVCIVLYFCCNLGGLVAFIVGWMNHRRWNITPVMVIWTVCWLLLFTGIGLAPPDFSELQRQFQGAR
jgi:hypothetical protein